MAGDIAGAPRRSLGWRFRRSWWLALIILSLGLLAWSAFLYVGAATRSRRWIVWAIFYLAVVVASFSLLIAGGSTDSTSEAVVGLLLWFGLWIGAFVHALLIRDEVLIRVSHAKDLRRARARQLERELADELSRERLREPVAVAARIPVRPEPGLDPAGVPEPRALGAYASWGQRFAAWLVDLLLIGSIMIVAAIAFIYAEDPVDQGTTGGALAAYFLGFLVVAPLALLYFTLSQGGKRGQTLGKRMVAIKVRRAGSLEAVGYGRALLRTFVILLVWIAGFFTAYLTVFVDGLWPLWDKKAQALHDKVCGTVVVRG